MSKGQERHEPWFDSEMGVEIVNSSDVPSEELAAALRANPEIATLTRWAQGISSPYAREGGLFERDKYLTPWNIFDQMRVAYEAAEEDDIVSAVLESTESLAFGDFSLSCEDPDEEDVWNQMMEEIELETRVKEIWRELFLCSQCYIAFMSGTKTFKVRGKNMETGVRKKKVFNEIKAPTGLTLLDPMKCLPVGNLMFNQEQIVYVAVPGEAQQFERILSEGLSDDTIVSQLITARYVPTHHERVRITQLGLPADHLFFLNPNVVKRLTLTRPQYMRFASVRMKPVFELLDMKRQLRQADRATILGAANMIILVKKGTDNLPATAAEVTALSQSVRVVSKVPVIVGDHRLSVEIIVPDLSHVLNEEKWTVLDSRIAARLYQMFTVGSSSKTGARDDSLKLARVVARGMQARRDLIRRFVVRNIIKPIYEANDELTTIPTLTFHPRRISLDFDPAVAQFIQDLRASGDLSRQTTLDELDFDQVQEARNREREQKYFDKIFELPIQPGLTGAANAPTAAKHGATKGPNTKDPDQDLRDGLARIINPAGTKSGAKPGAKQDPKTAGRTQGGNRRGGGASGGTAGTGKTKPGGSPATKPRGPVRQARDDAK